MTKRGVLIVSSYRLSSIAWPDDGKRGVDSGSGWSREIVDVAEVGIVGGGKVAERSWVASGNGNSEKSSFSSRKSSRMSSASMSLGSYHFDAGDVRSDSSDLLFRP